MSTLRGTLLASLIALASFTLASCSGDDTPAACTPADEICDGADNDCDGEVDETCAPLCYPNATECTDGKLRTCGADGAWGAFSDCPSGSCADDIHCLPCDMECTPGVTECADGRQRACAGQGACGKWGQWSDCASGFCGSAATCGSCTNGCAQAGLSACANGRQRTCVADANGCLAWGPETACADGFCLNASNCGSCADECTTAGQTSCAQGKRRTCVADANGCLTWGPETSCTDGFCASATTCGTCTNGCATVGATQCSNGQLRSCVADANGCRSWGAFSACTDGFCASTQSCGNCSNTCPTSGQSECSGGRSRTCQADGNGCLAWSSWSSCADGFCANATNCGTCNDECSAVGATQCSSGRQRTCEADANGCLLWSSYSSCASGFCASATTCGTCTNGCATLGATECSGGQLRTCVADANGCRTWSSQTACQDGFCASATSCGTCNHGCAAANATECTSGQLRTCTADTNGCRSWSAFAACPESYCTSTTACGSPPVVILISEIRYDSPSSPDTGAFVELAGPAGTSLAGLTLVGVNGNGGADYNPIALSGAIPADGFYLVARLDGPLASVADLQSNLVDYQNGPDSVQLRRGTTVLDAVGYGSFTASDTFAGEGSAASATPTNGNSSLSRDAALSDTGNNAADFALVETPTPGRAAGSCTDACTAGASTCSEGLVSQCAIGASGCLEWGTATSCDSGICRDSQTCDRAPVAALSCPNDAMATEASSFDASGSIDADGDALSYAFDFGDGATATGSATTQQHTFAAAGNYTVSVQVTDPSGASDTAQCSLTVAPFALPDRIVSANETICGTVRAGRFIVQGGATVSCPSGSLTVLADEISVDPASAIDLSATSATASGSDTSFCMYGCACDAAWVGGGGGGGGATGGTASSTTYGSSRSFEYGGCVGSCGSVTCSGSGGGSSTGSTWDLSATAGGAGGRGCQSGYSQCNAYYAGGKGGGAIKLVAARSISILGRLSADGAAGTASSPTAGAGGGGGGSVVLVAPDLSVTGQVSAAAGVGGTGSKPSSYYNSANANGGNGGNGRIKLAYGTRLTKTGTLTGTVLESPMPPVDLRSSTHPSSNLAYNDAFSTFEIAWTAPFAGAQGYWYALNKSATFALTPANGTYTTATSVSFPKSAFTSAGTWYFHVVTTNGTGFTGVIANRFPINVNATAHTISSSSHASQTSWYTSTALALSWAPPAGASASSFPGFWYRLDRVSNSDTSAGTAGWTFTPNTQVVLTTDASGAAVSSFAYHFHLVAEDTQGHLTSAPGHYRIQIGSAAPATTNVFGYVKDGSGTAINGAAVRLEPFGLTATTDANGYFLINGVFEGPYTLTAGKSGYQTATRSQQISAAAMPLNVTLTP